MNCQVAGMVRLKAAQDNLKKVVHDKLKQNSQLLQPFCGRVPHFAELGWQERGRCSLDIFQSLMYERSPVMSCMLYGGSVYIEAKGAGVAQVLSRW